LLLLVIHGEFGSEKIGVESEFELIKTTRPDEFADLLCSVSLDKALTNEPCAVLEQVDNLRDGDGTVTPGTSRYGNQTAQ